MCCRFRRHGRHGVGAGVQVRSSAAVRQLRRCVAGQCQGERESRWDLAVAALFVTRARLQQGVGARRRDSRSGAEVDRHRQDPLRGDAVRAAHLGHAGQAHRRGGGQHSRHARPPQGCLLHRPGLVVWPGHRDPEGEIPRRSPASMRSRARRSAPSRGRRPTNTCARSASRSRPSRPMPRNSPASAPAGSRRSSKTTSRCSNT